MATVHYNTLTLNDYSGEQSSFQVYNGSVTALTIATYLDQLGNLREATEAITKGNVTKQTWVGDAEQFAAATPTDVFAQRELKWLVSYENAVSHKKYTLEIPTADPTGRLIAASDKANLAQTEVAAWITAFEAIGRSPENDVDGVNVLSMTLVGRNI